jgi:flagellar biosynthesis/type III secretory pathway M-ring protein FliF/YscJ
MRSTCGTTGATARLIEELNVVKGWRVLLVNSDLAEPWVSQSELYAVRSDEITLRKGRDLKRIPVSAIQSHVAERTRGRNLLTITLKK